MSLSEETSTKSIYAAAVSHTLWDIFTNEDAMRAIVDIGITKTKATPKQNTAYLIGEADTATAAPASTKPVHPCFLPFESRADATFLNLFEIIDPANKMELQFGVLVFLAVDADAREKVASLSPPLAAQLARNIPALLHKALLGTPHTAAQPVAEFVVRFAHEIERVYQSTV